MVLMGNGWQGVKWESVLIIFFLMQEIASIQRNKNDKSITLMPEQPYFSLIWLHGLGDTSEGFLYYFQQEQSPLSIGGRIRLLNAPMRKVSINYGAISTSWYDIFDLSPHCQSTDRFDIEQVKESLAILESEVTKEIEFWRAKGVTGSDEEISKRIFVGGFSQGSAMSLCYALTGRLLGGVIGCSGHLFPGLQFKNIDKVPMLVYHGDSDNVLRYKWVQPDYQKYLKPYPNFNFKLIKGMGHTVTMEQLKEITAWVDKQLQKTGIRPL